MIAGSVRRKDRQHVCAVRAGHLRPREEGQRAQASSQRLVGRHFPKSRQRALHGCDAIRRVVVGDGESQYARIECSPDHGRIALRAGFTPVVARRGRMNVEIEFPPVRARPFHPRCHPHRVRKIQMSRSQLGGRLYGRGRRACHTRRAHDAADTLDSPGLCPRYIRPAGGCTNGEYAERLPPPSCLVAIFARRAACQCRSTLHPLRIGHHRAGHCQPSEPR